MLMICRINKVKANQLIINWVSQNVIPSGYNTRRRRGIPLLFPPKP